jgi:hypothetical protein
MLHRNYVARCREDCNPGQLPDGVNPNGQRKMKLLSRVFFLSLFVVALSSAPLGRAQAYPQRSQANNSALAETRTQKANIQEYIDLLRRDVRQQKAEIMGAVMVLNAQDAEKFWPIYSDYDAQLAKLNDQRVEKIKEYARSYNNMTDQKADELVQRSMDYQKRRSELLAKTYDMVKDALGGITAARFAMIEHQLLLIIDLQVVSSLPVVGQGS